ncbi:MAG: hypothetical protein IJ564_04520 [Alphaproteobacteria bacterium]|nr:hypothetical protein [Alphaproteobacteria bacterium]
MTKNAVINFIISDLSEQITGENTDFSTGKAINDVIDKWQHKIYIVPEKAVKINHSFPKKYPFM